MVLLNNILSYVVGAILVFASGCVAMFWIKAKRIQNENDALRKEKTDAEVKAIADRVNAEPLDKLVSESNSEWLARKNNPEG